MPAVDDLPINDRLTIPADELTVTTSRSSGPGGQHVNTADTRVQLRWNPSTSRVLSAGQLARLQRALASRLTTDGDLIVASGSERSQHRNRELARQRLADLVRRALIVPKARHATGVPRAQKRKRRDDKRRRGEVKRLRRRPDGD